MNVAHRLLQIADAAAYAAKDGATVLVTPEMAVTGYALGPDVVAALAEPADGAYYTAIADICRANKIAIAYGFPERGRDDAVYNSLSRPGRALAWIIGLNIAVQVAAGIGVHTGPLIPY